MGIRFIGNVARSNRVFLLYFYSFLLCSLFYPFLVCSLFVFSLFDGKGSLFREVRGRREGLFELLEKHFPGQSLPGVSVAGSCSGQEARVAGNFYEDAAGLALHPGSATAALPCSERPCSNSPRERESRSPADNILSSDG